MKFNTAVRTEKSGAFHYFMTLANQKKVIEIKKVSPGRSLNQNSYLHLLIAYLAAEVGEDPETIKHVYKSVNNQLYLRKHTAFGRDFTSFRSSADLTVDEMTISIDRFRHWSAEKGYPLPPATDQAWLREIENTIEQSKWH